ncbi:alpha/beta hydrolase [Mesorhizobium sp. BAC0120]|uniref:dienelactone hydrolase family protein n=1 Tax=Mesorhizobium sp. BAC0120 TaxID=3090670 RepID=UPI00298BDE83|nr:alpha/beta hydrolase [Mesorhizobium sp. BAC0120]MDW6021180.1 alpha/beta hydrolase [Mesorhizobium sp. BAC0120]
MARSARNGRIVAEHEHRPVTIGPLQLPAFLDLPDHARGMVIFAHGSGSGRLSPRNSYVALALRNCGLATLLLDLLTPAEELDRANVFDIPLLASRLRMARDWTAQDPNLSRLPVGYFGASTGAGAALVASAGDDRISAIVSRGGRPDLAGEALQRVHAPTLLLVGGLDGAVIDLNRTAQRRISGTCELVIIESASHLFEESGTLDEVVDHASRWFLDHFATRQGAAP